MKLTVVIFDGGYKESAPMLESLKNQTILDELQVLWIEMHCKIYKEVYGDLGEYMDECNDLAITPKDCYDSYMICLFYLRYEKELLRYEGN